MYRCRTAINHIQRRVPQAVHWANKYNAASLQKYALGIQASCSHMLGGWAILPRTLCTTSGPKDQGTAALPKAETNATIYKDQNDTWVDRSAPAWAKPYLKLMRVDRPIGTWLVLLPGWWGLALAATPGSLPDITMMALFGVGAFAMRGAGCTVNDMWDKDFDGKVARTAQRPLASGQLSMFNALTFLGAQLSAALGVLLHLNIDTIKLGFAAVPLVVAYPLMKRLTYLPQVVLGFAMNYGILMGWSAIHGTADIATALPLYAGSIAWTVVYDTLYAHQDKHDDAKLGLKSTALLMKDNSRAILTSLAALSGVSFMATGVAADLAWPFYVGTLAATGHMVHQTWTADYEDRLGLTKRFVSNQWIGWIMLASITLGRLMQGS